MKCCERNCINEFINLLKGKISNKSFLRNVITVASGTIVSQFIIVIFSPFITRLYSPDAYGLQGVFMSALSLISTVGALGYPIAIILPKKDEDAMVLVFISVFIGLIISVIFGIALIIIGNDTLKILNAESISQFKYLLPIAMYISVLTLIQSQWMIREKAFEFSSKYMIYTALILGITKLFMGYIMPSAMVLISANIIGAFIGLLLTYYAWVKRNGNIFLINKSFNIKNNIFRIIKKYIDFPLLRTPQNLLNTFSQSLPVFLLASYFGLSSAGHYSIAISLLGMPSAIIGNSVMNVFYPRINEAIHNEENIRKLVIKATKWMVISGIFPFTIIAVIGPQLFAFVFGEKWFNAGVYAQLLSPWLFFQYINKPAVSAIPGLRLQSGLLIYEIFSTGSKVVSLYLGYKIYKNDNIAIALFSFSGIIAYVWLILWVINKSQNHKIYNNVK